MDKRAIIFFCILIALPFGGIYLLIKGIMDNNIAQLISGVISCVIAFILWVVVIYFIKKHHKDGQESKKILTPEEQRQRNLAFVKKHSNSFLVWSIVSVILAVVSLILLIVFVEYDFSFYFSIPMLAFALIFVALFASYMGVKWENKKNNIDEETNNGTVFEKTETTTTETMTGQEQRNTEAKQCKAEQEQKQREWFWEQQRKEREEERREREQKQQSIDYLNAHKYILVEKYSEAVFNFIEKLTETYPYLFLKMFKDTEIPMSSIIIKPYNGKSQLLETKILFDGLEFTEAADYIYENNIELPFVDTYKKIVLDMKQIFERKKKEKLENDLFGKPKKKTVTENDTPHTLSPIERIDRMTGEQFEIFMENFFRKQGFKVTRTPLSGDYGIDLIIENDFSKIGVQAKRYSEKVSLSAVQEVIGGLRHYGLSSGMVVTNSTFQASAIQLAKDNNITLWNRDKLIEKLGE